MDTTASFESWSGARIIYNDRLGNTPRENLLFCNGEHKIPKVIDIIGNEETNTTYRIATYGNDIFTVEKNNTMVSEELEKESRWNILVETETHHPTIFKKYCKAKEYLNYCLYMQSMDINVWNATRLKSESECNKQFE